MRDEIRVPRDLHLAARALHRIFTDSERKEFMRAMAGGISEITKKPSGEKNRS